MQYLVYCSYFGKSPQSKVIATFSYRAEAIDFIEDQIMSKILNQEGVSKFASGTLTRPEFYKTYVYHREPYSERKWSEVKSGYFVIKEKSGCKFLVGNHSMGIIYGGKVDIIMSMELIEYYRPREHREIKHKRYKNVKKFREHVLAPLKNSTLFNYFRERADST